MSYKQVDWPQKDNTLLSKQCKKVIDIQECKSGSLEKCIAGISNRKKNMDHKCQRYRRNRMSKLNTLDFSILLSKVSSVFLNSQLHKLSSYSQTNTNCKED